MVRISEEHVSIVWSVRTDSGNLDSMIEGVESFGRLGRRCHNSSVTNGMKGCKSLSPWSKQVYNVS